MPLDPERHEMWEKFKKIAQDGRFSSVWNPTPEQIANTPNHILELNQEMADAWHLINIDDEESFKTGMERMRIATMEVLQDQTLRDAQPGTFYQAEQHLKFVQHYFFRTEHSEKIQELLKKISLG